MPPTEPLSRPAPRSARGRQGPAPRGLAALAAALLMTACALPSTPVAPRPADAAIAPAGPASSGPASTRAAPSVTTDAATTDFATRAADAGAAPTRWTPVAGQPGLLYERDTRHPGEVLHWLRLDLRDPRLRLTLSTPEQRGRTLDAFDGAATALATVNASFFDRSFQPRGLTRSQGRDWSPVMAAQRSPLLTCDAARRCDMQLQPPHALPADSWLAVAGTPWLVRHGRARDAGDDRQCPSPSFCGGAHPRTALGLDRERRHLFIVLAEGRRADTPGLSLSALAERLVARGVAEALNLDGGGSSHLLLSGEGRMARPRHETALRPLANALLIRLQEDAAP